MKNKYIKSRLLVFTEILISFWSMDLFYFIILKVPLIFCYGATFYPCAVNVNGLYTIFNAEPIFLMGLTY